MSSWDTKMFAAEIDGTHREVRPGCRAPGSSCGAGHAHLGGDPKSTPRERPTPNPRTWRALPARMGPRKTPAGWRIQAPIRPEVAGISPGWSGSH